jgi:hypothetical protein
MRFYFTSNCDFLSNTSLQGEEAGQRRTEVKAIWRLLYPNQSKVANFTALTFLNDMSHDLVFILSDAIQNRVAIKGRSKWTSFSKLLKIIQEIDSILPI